MTDYTKKITYNAIQRITDGEELQCPVFFQILGSKKVPSPNGGADRYRLLTNDGVQSLHFLMLSSGLADTIAEDKIEEYSILRVDRFIPSRVNRNDKNDKNIIIVFDAEIVQPGSKIGRAISGAELTNTPISGVATSAQKENVKANSQFVPKSSNHAAHTSAMNSSLNASVTSDLSESLTVPIENLSPYQNKWVIKVRVTSKSPIRSWKNAKGEGKLFSIDLCDETGEIRCTGFRDAVDKFYDMLEVDKVYFISRCQLKPANKQYSKLNNDYEMTMTNDTQVQVCTEGAASIPKIKYNLVPISELAAKNKDDIVDVIGVCKEAAQPVEIVARSTGQQLTKREVTLVDNTDASIVLTLWGQEALNFDPTDHPVILAKGVKVGEYGGGKTLGTMTSTTMLVNPELPEGYKLKGWFDQCGTEHSFVGLSNRMGGGNLSTEWATFHDCVVRQLGQDKTDYFQTMAMVHSVRSENMIYKACPNKDCNKKVVEGGNGTYRCEKCNTESGNFKNRLLASMLIGDWTSNRWVTFFAETAEKILGRSTDDLAELMDYNKNELDAQVNNVLFKPMIFKLRTRTETYGDIPRNKITGIAVGETKIKDYNAHLLANIRRLSGIETRPQAAN